MNDENTNHIELSRRKVLGGLGAIGVASAGAGLGTTAFFSDSEEFTGNTITAGQFALHVTQSTHLVDQDGMGPDEMMFDEMVGENEYLETFFDITDAKPGDSYKYCWDICVKHNPGFVEITLETVEDATGNDNGVEHVDASGTLGEYMLAVVTIDDQQAGDDTDVVFAGTLGEFMAEFAEGGLVHAWEDDEVTKYCHLPCESDVEGSMIAQDSVEVCVHLYLPSHADVDTTVEVAGEEFEIEEADSPGNLVQGASFEANVAFAAEQCRHNTSPFDGSYNVSDNSPPPGQMPTPEPNGIPTPE